MIFRVSFIFDGMSVGWTETHMLKATTDQPIATWGLCAAVAEKRVQMLGREFRIKGFRVSRYATDAGVRIRGVAPQKRDFRNSVQTQSAAAEPAAVALLVDCYASPEQAPPGLEANTKRIFFGAPLDVSVDNAGLVDKGKGGLGAAFDSWRVLMLQDQWGWLGNQTILDVPVVSTAQNVNGTVTMTFEAGALDTLTLGQRYKARGRQFNNGRSPLNIELVVRKASTTTLVTQRIIGIPTPQTNGALRVYKQVQPFIEYAALELRGEVGKHQRGRPIGSSPGRQPARILG